MADTVVGRLVNEITADTSKLEAGVDRTKREMDDAAQKSKEAGRTINNSFNSAGSGIENATAGARKFVGAISSTLGIMTGLISAVTLVVGIFNKLRDSLNASAEQAAAANRQFQDFRKQVRALDPNQGALPEYEKTFSALGAQIRESNLEFAEQKRLLDDLRSALFLRREIEEQNAQRAAANRKLEASAQAEAIRQALVNEVESSQEDLERKRSALFREEIFRIEQLGGLNVEQIEEIIRLEDIRLNRNLERIEKEKKAKIDAENAVAELAEQRAQEQSAQSAERARQDAERAAAAFRAAFEGIADDIFGTAGNSFTTRLDTLVSDVSALRRELRGIK